MHSRGGQPLEGQQLGAYQLVELIGTGGIATVYRAYQPSLNRHVAIKVLPAQYAEETFVARFQREAEVAARLQHPHILDVYDYGQHQGMLYMVMPYIAGGTLEQRLHATPPPPRDWALGILLQICSALGYAHRHRVIHRDIKPSNVLLREENWALLADFGVARLLEAAAELTARGVVLGTPEYMAPEQGRGLPIDYRADVYAVGILLYRVLSGELPFTGASSIVVMTQQVEAPPPPLRLPNPAAAQIWSAVLARALAKAPSSRYQSMEEFATAIQRAMEQERTLETASTSPRGRGEAVRTDPPGGGTRSSRLRRPADFAVGDGPASAAPRGTREYRVRVARTPLARRAFGLLPVVAALVVVALGALALRPRDPIPAQATEAPAMVIAPTPAPTPGPSPTPSAGTILLQDDFSDPESGWPRQSSDPTTRRVGYVDGEYSIVKLANAPGAPFVTRNTPFRDFQWEIDARLLPPTSGAYVFLDFRRQENGDHYTFIVDPNDGTFRVDRNVGQDHRQLIPWTKSPAIQQGTARNHLEVRAQGGTIVLAVNEQEVGRVRDDTLREGALGFGVNNLERGSADGRFSNLLVTALAPSS